MALPKRFRIFVIIGLVFLAGATTTVLLILKSDLFLPLRQSLVAELIGDSLGHPISINGDVSFAFADNVKISISDAVFVEGKTRNVSGAEAFKRVSFECAYSCLVGKVKDLGTFQMAGATIIVRPPTAASSGEEPQEAPAAFRIPSAFLKSRLSDDFLLSDVQLRYVDEPNGWDEAFDIRTLRFRRPSGSGKTAIAFAGTTNGYDLTLEGEISRGDWKTPLAVLPITIRLEVSGLTSTATGTIDISNPVAIVDLSFNSRSESIGDFLEAAGLAREIEGTGDATGTLSGPLDSLALADLSLSARNEFGDTLDVTGSVGDLVNGSAISLDLRSTLAPLAPRDPDADDAFAIETTGLTLHLSGSRDKLSVSDAHVITNLAVLELGDFGPISVERVVKQPDNRVSLEGIDIRHGPAEAPYLELRGRIGDLLGLEEIHLSGGYHVPTAEAFGLSLDDANALGRLAGEIEISDQDGLLSLRKFTAAVTGTDLLSFDAELSIAHLRRIDAFALETELDIPDLAAYASVFGVTLTHAAPVVAFDGTLTLRDSSFSADGALQAGASKVQIDAKLSEDTDNGLYAATGDIRSAQLDVSDFAGLIELTIKGEHPHLDPVEIAEAVKYKTRMKIGLDIEKLITNKAVAGNVAGTLGYEDLKLSLAPLALTYLGGTIKGDFSADFNKKTPVLSAKGRIEKWRLGRLMREFGLTAPFNSTIYMSFDVNGAAGSAIGLLKSLTGRVTASLWGGEIPTRLIDLTGLNLVTWVFSNTSGKDTSKLVCAVMPLHFKNGRASTTSLIIETENVQIVGGGSVDLRSETMDLSFVPRPKRKQVVDIVSPFSIKGHMGKPNLEVKQAGAGRAIGETLSLPLNLLGRIFGGGGLIDEKAKPCVLPKATGPK